KAASRLPNVQQRMDEPARGVRKALAPSGLRRGDVYANPKGPGSAKSLGLHESHGGGAVRAGLGYHTCNRPACLSRHASPALLFSRHAWGSCHIFANMVP